MKETEVTAKIVKGLNSEADCYTKKRHSGKFGSGDPDLSGCFAGKSFHIETKVVGGELTQLQAIQLERWRKAGAATRLAIYDHKAKTLQVVELDDKEKWEDFTGHDKLKELIVTTAQRPLPFKDFNYQGLLEDM